MISKYDKVVKVKDLDEAIEKASEYFLFEEIIQGIREGRYKGEQEVQRVMIVDPYNIALFTRWTVVD